VKSGDIQGSF